MIQKIWILFAIILAFPGILRAQSAQSAQNTVVLCKLQQQVRTLRIFKNEDRYALVYRKFQRDEELGRFQYVKSAVQVMKEVQQNLEKSDWACREVVESKISDVTQSQ